MATAIRRRANGMASSAGTGRADVLQDDCERCGEETRHAVTVELRSEAGEEALAAGTDVFAREPYRVAECDRCGTRQVDRCF
jgi:ribosomal protein L37E